ncbi:hypothetical protein JX265_012505 [Neoarthrinium moseri]|uniref:Uncharacterized protein n=1 Tax=Neoarthrinium moseri TaxID=1658444 RepID=A0A9Q0AIK0_9PEZI|nr:hypothetical protein JX265_012505 [Neoarthrinium moseri]
MSSYVPPHRRSQAAGSPAGGLAGDDGPLGGPSPNQSHYSHRGGRGQRPDRRGYRRGRGTGRLFTREPPVDDADVFHARDITQHFWSKPGSEGDEGESFDRIKSSTFHSSVAQPDKLSYMLLFTGANPRWASDGIVFAKTALGLLPEYATQKEKRGPWDTPVRRKNSNTEVSPDAQKGLDVEGNTDASTARRVPNESQDTSPGDKEFSVVDHNTGEAQASSANDAPTDIRQTEGPSSESRSEIPTRPSDTKTIPVSDIDADKMPTFLGIAPIDYNPGPHAPIAVFAERKHITKNVFAFAGWYSVTRISILAPHSAELVRMQQQKWERRDRFGNIIPSRSREMGAWKTALSQEWAVVKFEKLVDEAAPPAPTIDKWVAEGKPDGSGETRSVNEMLKGMRMTDGNLSGSGEVSQAVERD